VTAAVTAPTVARSARDLAAALEPVRAAGGTVVLAPTMGALHEGHTSLLRLARGYGDALVASIFVNPLQFAPGEDLDRYPRALDADLELCAAAGVDAVFAPDTEQIYPGGEPVVTIDPGPLGRQLEGAVRPSHFRGVLTVVAKLFGLVRPDTAVFGQKDYQQLVLIEQMVRDLAFGVRVVGGETVRESDGLALSSRNRYLGAEDRVRARALSQALYAGAAAGADGPEAVLAAASAVLSATPEVRIDYLALRAPDLGPAPPAGDARLLVAGRVGATRLIDNLPVPLGNR